MFRSSCRFSRLPVAQLLALERLAEIQLKLLFLSLRFINSSFERRDIGTQLGAPGPNTLPIRTT